MTNEMELVVAADGSARCIDDEALDLREIGKLQIIRASHVEPDAEGSWWADMGPSGGPLLGPALWQQYGGVHRWEGWPKDSCGFVRGFDAGRRVLDKGWGGRKI